MSSPAVSPQPSLGEVRTLPLPGNTAAVMARYQDMVYSIALTHTRCWGDADDVFQEVFLTYHRRQPDCNSEEHRKAWLIRTTLNCAKESALSSWRTRVVSLTPDAGNNLPTADFSFATDEQDALFRALATLPETYRTVLHLFYFEDLPTNEIANLMGLAVGAVKVRLSRGRTLMRQQLQGAYFNE